MMCQLCGQDKKLRRAHIIPEAFVRAMGVQQPEVAVMLSSNTTALPKRLPIGVYDSGIVCGECELRFGPWDQYAAELLIRRLDSDFQHITHGGEIQAFQLVDYDYERLKMFFISLLWRAALSSQEFYKGVSLGPHQDAAKRAILTASPDDSDVFGVVLARWITEPKWESLTTIMMSPFRERYDGINVFRFYVGRIIAYIKVDQRGFQEPFDQLMLSRGRPLYLISRRFDSSHDFAVLRKLAVMNEGKSKLFPRRDKG